MNSIEPVLPLLEVHAHSAIAAAKVLRKDLPMWTHVQERNELKCLKIAF